MKAISVRERRRTLDIEMVNTGSSAGIFQILLESSTVGISFVILDTILDGVRNRRAANDVVSGLGHGYMDAIQD